MSSSKPLSHDDSSGFEFAQEMLQGDQTYAINFDRIQKHPQHGYIIFEYLRCHEDQPCVTPYTSHPNKYFYKNAEKFISLYEIATALKAKLFLVNYAAKGTAHEDEILVMEVQNVDKNNQFCPVRTVDKKMTREEFSQKFRQLNAECKK